MSAKRQLFTPKADFVDWPSLNCVTSILIVNGEVSIHYTVAEYLEVDPDITVVGSARDGFEALAKIPALKPDVVILDVETSCIDNLVALKQIMVEYPVIMLGHLTQWRTSLTIQMLMLVAYDFALKPDARIDIHTVIEELKAKVKNAATTRLATL